jgi:hypothetical protein
VAAPVQNEGIKERTHLHGCSLGTIFAGNIMGRYNGWKALSRYFDAPNVKRWYKKLIHRKNRRAAKQNPERASERKDKPLDPWAID